MDYESLNIECILCYKNINNDLFPNIINDALKGKYCENIEEQFYSKPVRNIIKKRLGVDYIFYKESKFYKGEYFNKIYNKISYKKKLKKYSKYYTDTWFKPNIYLKNKFKIHFKFYNLKYRLFKNKKLYNDELYQSKTFSSSICLSSKIRNILNSISINKNLKKSFKIQLNCEKIKKEKINTTEQLIEILENSKINNFCDPSFLIKNKRLRKTKTSKNKKFVKKLFFKIKLDNKLINHQIIYTKNNNKKSSLKIKISKNKKNKNKNKFKSTNTIKKTGKLIKGSNFQNKKLRIFKTQQNLKTNKFNILKPNSLSVLNAKIRNLNKFNLKQLKTNCKTDRISNFKIRNISVGKLI